MFRHQQISRAVLALCAGGFAATSVAQAQQPSALPRVEVTGSNIKRIDAETVAPVEIITREQIQRTGQPTVADVLRNLPANTGSFGENFTNSFAPGAAGISLRGLGQKTTLVLVNGRRVTGYGFAQNLQDSFVDLNAIPSSAVERIEILKDGASAIYGSDAIAGVVNIILRKDFKGFEISAGMGQASGKNDYNASLTGGFGDLGSNKFNLFGVLDIYKRDLIQMSDTPFGEDRDYRGQPGGRNHTSLNGAGTWRQATPTGGNSSNFLSTASCRGRTITGPEALEMGLTTNAAFGAATNTFCSKDFNDQFTADPKTERIGFLGRGTYEFSPAATGFVEVGLSRNKSFQTFQDPFFAGTVGLQQTPAGLRPFPFNILFEPGVAGNPFPTRAFYTGVLGDMGTRNTDIQSDTVRLIGGVTYTVANWDLDSAIGYSRNKVKSESQNGLSLAGTGAVFNIPTTPQPPIPVSAASSYNLHDFTLNSDAVRDQLRINSSRNAVSTLTFLDTKGSTELQSVMMPGGPMGVAVGAEYRRESLKDRPTAAAQNGEILGQGITATDGSRNSSAVYAELRLPLLKNVEAQLAARYDHYSDYGSSATPKIGVKWTPTDMIALRANWGKGFRAPTLPEISPSVATFFTQIIDPDDDAVRNISGVFAGNPDLKAETSKSLNLGIVFEPTKDASISVDYYRIRWKNIVNAPSFQDIVDESCPNGGTAFGNAPCPSTPVVIRNPADNTVVTVLSNYENLASTVTSGFDVDMRYGVPTLTFGKFTGRLNATYVRSFKENGTSVVGSNLGSNTIPRMKYAAALDWDIGAWRATTRLNYIKGWRQEALPGSFFGAPPQDPRFQTGIYPEKVASYHTLDLYGSYQFNKNLMFSASVLNAFDRKPPYDPGFSAAFLYDFSQFDAKGRLFRFNVTYAMQ